MTLIELCNKITGPKQPLLPDGHALGQRLICPEYSRSAQEVKTYPLISHERIFALCWNLDSQNTLYATLCPAPQNFRYRYSYTPGESTQLHTHDYLELGIVVKGEFCQRILGKEIVFKQGEACLIDKNCLHQDLLRSKDAVVLFLGIENSMFSEIMDESITTKKIISFLQSALLKQKNLQQYLHFRSLENAAEELNECLAFLLHELYHPQTGSPYIYKGLLLRIFRILSSRYEFSLSKELKNEMSWIVFEEISDYIEHHSGTITIQELCSVFHFQEDYFNRLIKKKTGMTYSAFVQQIRLKKAERMLMTTQKSVSQIAEAVGYHNKGYFYKIFREMYGMTPKEYRKR